MSSQNNDGRAHEIVIVRRRGNEDEGHHGGVWKIAYADFMTAMMAFFLVMWLINSTDEKTLTQVASYFNPLKLTDKVSDKRGVRDLENLPETGQDAVQTPTRKQGEAGEKAYKKKFEEEALFRDPFGVLSQLAMSARKDHGIATGGPRAGDGASARSQPPRMPDIFVDPFGPPATKAPTIRSAVPEPVTHGDDKPGAPALPKAQEMAKAEEVPKPSEAPKPAETSRTKADELKDEVEKALRDLDTGIRPAVEVRGTPDGILISLSDNAAFGMFEIGSAVPQVGAVAVMDRLAEVLKARPGRVVVRGHTDGRPYRDENQGGNWQLSSDRARIAYFMLRRGGVEEGRFARIEGHADRTLKVSVDPLAAENRRIEILLLLEGA